MMIFFQLMTSLDVARKVSGGISGTDVSKKKLKDMCIETLFAHAQFNFAVFSKNMRNQLAVSVDYKGNRLLPIEKYYFGQNIDIFN